ncbi:hypothetical protein QJQ45_022167 [Haematococcus lacustris]|nr:hypothetical protein QJQ45_022167 [Haematococcus lacustris]
MQHRTWKLSLTLVGGQASSSEYMTMAVETLTRLPRCAAVDTCKLGPSIGPLGFSQDLAPLLMERFPSLTSLSMDNSCIPKRDLSSLLSHPLLSMQLQHLDINTDYVPDGLPGLLGALPKLNSLTLPRVWAIGQGELDAMLAATQLTGITLASVTGLQSSRADSPCNWQRLQFTKGLDVLTAAYLPFHSLTQPLVMRGLDIDLWAVGDEDVDHGDEVHLVEAAIHHLTEECKVPVLTDYVQLDCFHADDMSNVDASVQNIQSVLYPLHQPCHVHEIMFKGIHGVSASLLPSLAFMCQGCTSLSFIDCTIEPSLSFWHQVVLHMPTIVRVGFNHVPQSISQEMHQSLEAMADEQWARWLDISIEVPFSPPPLPSCWKAGPVATQGKFSVRFPDPPWMLH